MKWKKNEFDESTCDIKKNTWWLQWWGQLWFFSLLMKKNSIKKTFRGHTEAYVYCMAYKNMHFLCSSVLNPFCIRSILLWNIHTRRNWPQIFDYNHLFIIQCTAGQKEIMKRRAVNTEGADGQLSPIFGWSVNPIPTKRRAG